MECTDPAVPIDIVGINRPGPISLITENQLPPVDWRMLAA
jgi:hypothetical protein